MGDNSSAGASDHNHFDVEYKKKEKKKRKPANNKQKKKKKKKKKEIPNAPIKNVQLEFECSYERDAATHGRAIS